MIYDQEKLRENTLICPTENFSVFVDFATFSYLIEYFVFCNGNINQRTAGSLQSLHSCAYLVFIIICKHYFLADVSKSDLQQKCYCLIILV